jgi:hypothetical protein
MVALLWFMEQHTNFSQTPKEMCLKQAHFVLLTSCYVTCKELAFTLYRQTVGAAMGTS